METTKQERVDIVNQIIKEIASRGRKFFSFEGNVAELFIRDNKIYYKCDWVHVSRRKLITEICFSGKGFDDPKGFYHGGTLKALIQEFCVYIETGDTKAYDGGYGGLYGYYWAYSQADMNAIQNKAIELGYVSSFVDSVVYYDNED